MPEEIVARILRLPGYGVYAWEFTDVWSFQSVRPYWTCPGLVDGELLRCARVGWTPRPPDATEFIERREFPFAEVVRMVERAEIKDSMSASPSSTPHASAEANRPPQPLSAPSVRPRTMCFCTNSASRSTGSVMTVAAAVRPPQLISS